jgi:hypothetical protein
MKRNLLLLTILMIFSVVAFGIYYYLGQQAVKFVTIDINPSVELAVDNNDEVVEVIPLNEDADIMLVNLELEGLTLDEATTEIIDEATEIGYIDEYSEDNTVLVSVVAEEDDERIELEEKVLNVVNSHIEKRGIGMLVFTQEVTDEMKEEAESYGITNGKMLMIDRAVLLNEELDKEELVEMSIKDIQGEIKEVMEERVKQIKQETENMVQHLMDQKNAMLEQKENRVKTMVEELKRNANENGEANNDNVVDNEVNEGLTTEEREEMLEEIKDVAKENAEKIKNDLKDELPKVNNSTKEGNINYSVDIDRYEEIKERVKLEAQENRNYPNANDVNSEAGRGNDNELEDAE